MNVGLAEGIGVGDDVVGVVDGAIVSGHTWHKIGHSSRIVGWYCSLRQ